jgi:hypothetical protein
VAPPIHTDQRHRIQPTFQTITRPRTPAEPGTTIVSVI